ncbi:MAG: multiprotein bridging factor aMBF1 [Candidatus Thermoplasmatota archaeon]|jgi:putative transcription factor|nr:multiprotein bridging factor aMBF1 [Candidatus Thermoplasmatota archaeon]MCL5790432.1 multiprotein bridging factor aMBF1 [Candidatus Thermoplasmatota archaeon]
MECEMCGARVDKLKKIKVDGAILSVCQKCERFGTPVESMRVYDDRGSKGSTQVNVPVKPVIIQRKPNRTRNSEKEIESLEIVPEYAEVIRLAREKTGMSQDEMADKLREKRTLISAIERGGIKPDIKTARKIENLLKIKILEEF